MFKRRRFPVEVILLCVRWYCKYGISYRDLTEMMQERGVEVDPSTIMRRVHRYAPGLEKRVRAYQGYGSTCWRVDETCVKVGGRWKYLFRAVDKHGRLIDFMLLERRNTGAAHRFLSKAMTTMRNWPATSITTDKLPLVSRGDHPAQARRPAIERHEASNLEVPEQHHRGRPWRAQKGDTTHTRLSDHAHSDSHNQGIRDHANDPARTVSDLQARCPQ